MITRIAFIVLLMTSHLAVAQTFKCSVDGKTVFQDRPCSFQQGPRDVEKTAEKQESPKLAAAKIMAEFEAEKRAKQDAEEKRSAASVSAESARLACEVELKKPALVKNSSWDGSVLQAVQYLNSNLREPDSFEAITWGNVKRTCDGYAVFVKYRAKNGFGGKAISTTYFLFNNDGTVRSAESL